MIEYRIQPCSPEAHLYRVELLIPEPAPEGQVLSMAAWIPGSYMIRDFARNLVALTADSAGRRIPVSKLDKQTWRCEPVTGPLQIVYEVYAWDLSVRAAHLDTTHAYFNGTSVFLRVHGLEDAPCGVELLAPEGSEYADWRVATTLPADGASPFGFGRYRAGDYDELIDHPVEMGNFTWAAFTAAGVPHDVVITGRHRADTDRLCRDLASICEQHIALFGELPVLRYLFLVMALGEGYGGLEHRSSTSLICKRDDLPRPGESKVSKGYRQLLGLCSHEYFHLWNVKRMKPARFTPYDLGVESHTGLLWVFEGITSYYDDLFLARSGLVTAESYLELLAKTITRVHRTPGRLRQSVEASSFDAWTGLYKQDANSPNAIISYYSKGALVALALDMTIRKESNGQYSLDDVVREAWSRYGDGSDGMPERGLESIAREVTGLELEDFFERYVRGTAELPLEGLLRSVGVSLRFRPAIDSKDTGGRPAAEGKEPVPWLGAILDTSDGASVFRVVFSDAPAERAGIAPGDEAVAIDGYRLTAGNLDARLQDYRDGDTVTMTVFRDHVLMRHQVVLGAPPEDTCYLAVDEDADESALVERRRWLDAD